MFSVVGQPETQAAGSLDSDECVKTYITERSRFLQLVSAKKAEVVR
jgi:hypothetical protein